MSNIHYKGRIYIDCKYAFPKRNEIQSSVTDAFYIERVEKFIFPLTSYPYLGTNLKDGQIVLEGIDYELKDKMYQPDQFSDTPVFDETVAIPKEQPDNQLELANRVLSVGLESLNKEETQEELCNDIVNGLMAGKYDRWDIQNKFTISRK